MNALHGVVGRISQCVADKTVGRFNRTLRAQADHVRQLARELRVSIYPEIVRDTQDCSLCSKPKLLIVHPDMACYSCLVDSIQAAYDEVFNRFRSIEAKFKRAVLLRRDRLPKSLER